MAAGAIPLREGWDDADVEPALAGPIVSVM